jgi:hypothetical protein
MFYIENFNKISKWLLVLLSVSILVFVILEYKKPKEQKGGSSFTQNPVAEGFYIFIGSIVGILFIWPFIYAMNSKSGKGNVTRHRPRGGD